MMKPEKWVFKLLLFLSFGSCISVDTITPSRPLKDGELLISEGKNFVLGFFSPGKSSFRYVGIWYYKVSEQTVVWVANRDRPINGVEPVGSTQHVLYRGSTRLWRSSPWIVLRNSFLSYDYRMNFTTVDNDKEVFHMYSLINSSIASRMFVDTSGHGAMFTWDQDKSEWVRLFRFTDAACDEYGHCGANGLCLRIMGITSNARAFLDTNPNQRRSGTSGIFRAAVGRKESSCPCAVTGKGS
ncbi:unnamed protein product [Thlaspi arvense]|uniref:Bulb-type lectin domain-containing protein n=1 Tax=Thlaspi arvense TaxID=13288 RepID=A0AAU9RGQ8_THLAR|nr:unnamed protein product [Thlaspi arvense]